MEKFKRFLFAFLASIIGGAIIFGLLYIFGKEEPIFLASGFTIGMFVSQFFKIKKLN